MTRPTDEPESVCRYCGESGADHDDCESKRKSEEQSARVPPRQPRGPNVPVKTSELQSAPDGWRWQRYRGWLDHRDYWLLLNKHDAYDSTRVDAADEWERMLLVAIANGFWSEKP
jgi:hypothetical protein